MNNPIGSPEVRVVEASAGSGKTYCLAARYVRLLISPDRLAEDVPLRDILAITFSNKASLEMKERILEFLKKLALDEFSSPDEKNEFLGYLSVREDLARAKAVRILEEIIRHYNFFQVQTIDSFINAILSACAFKFHLSASFRIKHNYREYLAYSFDKFIDRANNDPRTLEIFQDFLRQYILLENKKSWLPKADILSIMEALFSLSNIYGAHFIRPDISPKDLFLKRERIRGLMLKLKKKMPESANMRTWGGFVNSFDESVPGASIDKFFNPFSKDEFRMRKNSLLEEEALRLWQEIKGNIAELYEGKAFSRFNCYIDIFDGIAAYFEERSKKEDVLFLPQLNSHAHRLLDKDTSIVPELYYRLAGRLRHFLIDEFQDTSLLQWKNLFPLVWEALSTGGSLFYVGDKKQAIYRFRGGEVYLMEEVRRTFSQFNPRPELLSKNYRSQREVVEFNNVVFSADNLRSLFSKRAELNKGSLELSPEAVEDIISVFNQSRQTYRQENDQGYVKVEFIEAQDKEEAQAAAAGQVIALIEELKKRFSLGDIALLARSNQEVELLTSWLLEQGIPVESEKTLNIRENPYIKELLSFLRFLNSPLDNLSFASFILGDIFLKCSGINKKDIQRFLFGLAARKGHPDYLYIEFRREFPQAWEELIGEFFKNVGLAPLYELSVSIIRKLKVYDNFYEYQGFFMKLLEVIKDQEEDNQNLSLFLEFFDSARPEELYVNAAGIDSVKALTIHKSKGLEFPAVIIPFLEMEVKASASRGNDGGSFAAYLENDGLCLNYLVKEECLGFSPLLKARYLEEYKKSFIDELNSIYVAFTRPRYELYIFCQKKSAKGLNLAGLLFPPEGLERGRRTGYAPRSNPGGQPVKEIEPSRYQDWIQFLKYEFQGQPTLKKRDAVLRGDVRHYVLSQIGNLYGRDKGKALKEALAKARSRFPFIPEWEGFEASADKLLSRASLERFFFIPGASEVYPEKELVNADGDTRRIDRLIIKPDEAWVVDYKSSRLNPDIYKKQVQEYMDLVKGIYPRLKVRGFIIYLDDSALEEVNG